MSAPDPQAEKRRLRLAMRVRLAEATPASAHEAGRDLVDHLARLDAWYRAARIGLFMSRFDEIDTGPVVNRVLDAGKILLLPRMVGGGVLEFAAVDELARLERGPHGILEPPREWPATPPAGADLYCVPGLAFDRSGGRLGRGGGYYDRTFAASGVAAAGSLLLGIGFSFQLIEKVPMTDHDRRLDGVITDRETIESEVCRRWQVGSTGRRESR